MASTALRPAASDAGSPVPASPATRVQRLTTLLTPALVYLTIRQVSLLVLAWMSAVTGVGMRSALTAWDGAWFLGLAAGGYGGVPAGLTDAFGARTADTPLAFFPGYPALVAGVSWLPGVGVTTAAFAVTVGAGIAAAYGLVRLTESVPGGTRRAGLVLVALFAASPMSIVLSMTYSEALFCALAAWCLAAVLRGQWVLAGVLSTAAGLVRPTGAALVAVVLLAGAVAIARDRDGWRPWAGVLLAPSGLIGYLAFVAVRTGHWDGWFLVQQRGWNSRFDGGAATLRFSAQVLTTAPSILEVVTVWLLAGAVVLLVICAMEWGRGAAWPLLVYAAIVLTMCLGSNGLMNSKARLLLPAFVLLLPVAVGLARRRTAPVVLTLVAVVAFGAWFGGYAVTVWPYAI
ncbi:MAG TPA: hypothetical protein VGI84_08630 [Pseudonocardiaceae bacterium]